MKRKANVAIQTLIEPYSARDMLHEALVKQGCDYDLASDIVEELPYSVVEKIVDKNEL